MASFPWSSNSNENCGCPPTPRCKKSKSIFKRIASATGSWISGLLGVTTGQIIVRNDDTLGYYRPNCDGLVHVDTDGNASVGNVETLEGIATGNPLGYGYLPILELFDKEICDPDGGPPTEAQWMRIKALMPQLIDTGEIAVLNVKECASQEVRFDFLQPCPLPANGCPPTGLGYLASHICDVPGANGCVNKVRRWYWVTGLSIADGDLIKNASGVVDLTPPELADTELWRLPILRKRGGCWFFESMTRCDLLGAGTLEYRRAPQPIYQVTQANSDTTTVVAIPDYQEYRDMACPDSELWGIFAGIVTTQAGPNTTAIHDGYIEGQLVARDYATVQNTADVWGEFSILLSGPTVNVRNHLYLSAGPSANGSLQVNFHGFKLTPQ